MKMIEKKVQKIEISHEILLTGIINAYLKLAVT